MSEFYDQYTDDEMEEEISTLSYKMKDLIDKYEINLESLMEHIQTRLNNNSLSENDDINTNLEDTQENNEIISS